MRKLIKQVKTDLELTLYSDKIISILSSLNIAEKYKVLNCLLNTLTSLIDSEGFVIERREEYT